MPSRRCSSEVEPPLVLHHHLRGLAEQLVAVAGLWPRRSSALAGHGGLAARGPPRGCPPPPPPRVAEPCACRAFRRASFAARSYHFISVSVSSLEMNAPWRRAGSDLPGGMNSMSPLPSSASAPAPSMIVRLSTCDATRKAMRLGKFALMRPGDHVHARPLGGEDQVDADGARLLRQHRQRRLHLALHRHHQVGQLVDHDARCTAARRAVYVALLERHVRLLRLHAAARRPAPAG